MAGKEKEERQRHQLKCKSLGRTSRGWWPSFLYQYLSIEFFSNKTPTARTKHPPRSHTPSNSHSSTSQILAACLLDIELKNGHGPKWPPNTPRRITALHTANLDSIPSNPKHSQEWFLSTEQGITPKHHQLWPRNKSNKIKLVTESQNTQSCTIDQTFQSFLFCL